MRVPYELAVVMIDETDYWRPFDPDCPDYIRNSGRIFCAYLVDLMKAVHCCELTPSFELHQIGSIPEKRPTDPDAQEMQSNFLHDGDMGCEQVTYMHQADIIPHIQERVPYWAVFNFLPEGTTLVARRLREWKWGRYRLMKGTVKEEEYDDFFEAVLADVRDQEI